tara:strand:+ start:935 stop:1822 length:888 start_codon:yes stop_codon:yes gene_type:complete
MKKFIILLPVYNDWKSVSKLLNEIDFETKKWDAEVSIIIVNDASIEQRSGISEKYNKIKSIKIINMKKNRGHARCNAAGLKYINENENFDYVILMDGDGEDRPQELNLLFDKSKENPSKVITANRIKRSEGPLFKLLYEMHKILTYIFTGKLIKFGNYCCLTKDAVSKLTKEPSIWSSFSGSVEKVIFDRDSVSSIRGLRYFGPSQMNLFSLLIHSFSIIGVFRKSVIIRSIVFCFLYLFLISYKFSIINLLPIIAILCFSLLVLKVSLRANSEELSKSLENIDKIEILSSSNDR